MSISSDSRSVGLGFVLLGEPRAKGLSRTGVVYGRDGEPVRVGGNGRVLVRRYAPSRTRAWEGMVREAASEAFERPFEGPLELSVVFWFRLPASRYRKREPVEARLKETKPDLKNLVAGVEDGMNGVAWLDDRQVVRYGRVEKWYCGQADNRPRTEVWVRLLDGGIE